MATINGGSGGDHLNGTNGDDTINGNGGDDVISAGAGDDVVNGGAGNDTIDGGSGSDTLNGGDDNDTINGGSGDDNIDGGSGNDNIDGGSGDDTAHGGSGADTILGGSGNDTLYGDDDNDTIDGQSGNDTIWGGAGNDILRGFTGNDIFHGNGGDDSIHGGNGFDIAIYDASISEFTFQRIGASLVVKHLGGAGSEGTDTLSNIERLVFSDRVVNLGAGNNAPVAVDDSVSIGEDSGSYSSGSASVLDNDFDFEGDSLHVTAGTFVGTYGTLTLNANGTYSYVLNANAQTLAQGQTGQDNFNYTVSDGSLTDTGKLTFNIAGANDAPVAHADTASGTENQVLLVDVLANDTDVDNGHSFTVVSATAPSGQGSASIVSNKVQYNPGTDFDHLAQGATATVVVSYTMQDEHGASSSSTLTITVTGTNDAPVAVADTASGTENQVLLVDVLANDTDVDDGHSFTVTSATAPSGQGSASVVSNKVQYNPGTDFDHLAQGATATVVVNYTMQDEHGASSSSTLTITLTGTNDAPVAVADTASGTENQILLVDVLANDTDVDDGHSFTVTSATAPSGQGSASVVSNKVQFNPGTDFDHLAQGATATVVVNYTMQDENGASSASTLTITVTGTNDAPVAVADSAAGTENQILTINVLANDTDVDDGHVLTVTSASAPSGQGTASVVGNQVQFNPGTDFDHLAQGATQVVTVSYTIQDEYGATSASTIAITVTGTNDGPVANPDTAAGTENQVLTINVLANDTDVDDGHVLTVTSASAPSGQGTASVVGNQVQFNPGTDFDHLAQGATQVVTVNYTIQDEFGATSASTVTITVTGTNDAPVAVADSAAGTENQVLTINVLANDTDVDDSHVLTVTSASAPSGQGSASVVGNQVQFNPGTDFDHLAAGATQIVTVNYAIQDEFGATSASTIAITVTGTNDGPVANPDTASGTENQVLTINVLANDTDVDDGHVLTVTSASAPAGQGSASVVGNQVQFNPGTDFDHLAVGETQIVTVNYGIQDEHGAPSSSTVTITVTGTNDAPTINAGGTTSSGSVTELPNNDPGENTTIHHSDGTVAFADIDTSDVHSATATPQGGGYLGTFTLDPVNQAGDTVGWHFSVSDAALDSLNAGDTVTQVYTVEIDDGHGGTVDQNVTITIHGAADAVLPDGTNWYIDNSAVGSANNGSPTDPFTSIAAFNAAQGTPGGPGINDNVFLLAGTGTGVYAESDGINLLNGQVLAGVPTGAVRPTIVATAGDGINVAQGNDVSHIDIGNTSGAGIADSGGTVGSLHVTDVGKSGTGQIADLDQGGTLNVTLNNATSLGSSGGAIDLNAVGGSFTITGATTITGAQTGGGVDITASSLAFSLAGGGTIATGATNAVNFVGNSGSLALGGGLAISTTSGVGINATGGGTVTVTGAGNSLSSTTGTALNIANTNIGAADLTFQSISAGTAAGSAGVGISLVNTGNLGGLHVTGTGIAGSGGTIQHKTGADGSTSSGIGIFLNNTADVQLNHMQLNDFSNFAIRGTQVTGFTFDNSVISGTNGTAAGAFDEAAISFTNLLGTASISNSVIGNGFEYILKILNNSGTLNRLTMDNTDFGTNNVGLGGDAVQIVAANNATVNVTVTNSSFTNAREDLFNATAQQTANMDVVFRDNDMSNSHANRVSGASHILVSSTSTGNVTYDISHNDLTTGATGAAIAVVKGVPDSGTGGTMAGTVNANEIGLTGIVGSGADFTGIFASSLGSGTHTTAITNNVILHYNEEGIHLVANDPATGGNSVLNATVTGNVIDEPDSFAFAGLWVTAGSGSGTENNVVNVVVGNASTAPVAGSPTGSLQNDFSNGDPNDFSDVFFDNGGSGSGINLSRAGSAAADADGVIQDDNVGTSMVFPSGTVNLVNTLPPTPPPVAPLMAIAAGHESDGSGSVSQAALSGIVDAAIQRWADAGLSADQLAAMHATTVTAVGLHGLELGISRPGMILIDDDAAGNGWFVDSTPGDDSEFGVAGGSGGAEGHMDLLTVVMHELGHQIGLHDDYLGADADELMFGSLNLGERRLPDTVFETDSHAGPADRADLGLMMLSGPAMVPIDHVDIPGA